MACKVHSGDFLSKGFLLRLDVGLEGIDDLGMMFGSLVEFRQMESGKLSQCRDILNGGIVAIVFSQLPGGLDWSSSSICSELATAGEC